MSDILLFMGNLKPEHLKEYKMRIVIRSKIINLDADNEEFKRPYGDIWKLYFERTGRILGCQSKNHTQCKGEFWICERCGKRICWKEGSENLPGLCNDCWVDVREFSQYWENAD